MITPAIAARVASFVSDLEGLVRASALESARAALSAAPPSSTPSSTRATKTAKVARAKSRPATARPTANASPAKTAAANAAKPAAVARAKRGTRRSPEDVARAVRAIKAYLAEHPGSGVSTIASALGVATKDLVLPMVSLLGAKSIRKEGERRATKYFVTAPSAVASLKVAPDTATTSPAKPSDEKPVRAGNSTKKAARRKK